MNNKAFPNALGFGAFTRGGSAARVISVTSRNDSGVGSLRAALEVAAYPRTVIFEVSGYIKLKSDINIVNPFVTIAGQTAPDGGVTVRDYGIRLKTNDIIMQHIRIRPGDEQTPRGGAAPAELDTLSFSDKRAHNIIIDHCSLSWSIDETLSMWGDNDGEGPHDITISNCIIAEALKSSYHPKGDHSLIFLTPPNGRNISILRNLIAHATDRFPLISNGGEIYLANNIMYNWSSGRATGIGNANKGAIKALSPTIVSVLNNSYIAGPDTPSSAYAISTTADLDNGAKVFHNGNKISGIKNVWRNQASFDPLVATPPVYAPEAGLLSADIVESHVLLSAGARPKDRDAVDERILNDVVTRTGHLIDHSSDRGGFPKLQSSIRRLTIPKGIDTDSDGYTNVEEEILFPMSKRLEE